jgi:hypothetical protein
MNGYRASALGLLLLAIGIVPARSMSPGSSRLKVNPSWGMPFGGIGGPTTRCLRLPLIICGAVFATTLSSAAQAAPILDQSNLGMGTLDQGVDGVPPGFGSPVVAQTFKDGISGTLATVGLALEDPGTFSGTLFVDITTATPTTGPCPCAPNTAHMLGETTLVVPPPQFPTNIDNSGLSPVTAADLTIVNMSGLGIDVQAGTNYTIVLSSTIDMSLAWFGTETDSYIGGRSYNIGAGFITDFPAGDFFFETFVNPVPEPGALMLFGTMICMMLGGLVWLSPIRKG